MNQNRLAALVLAVVTFIIGLFAWKRQKADDAMDHDLAETGAHLNNPTMDLNWVHRQRYDGMI